MSNKPTKLFASLLLVLSTNLSEESMPALAVLVNIPLLMAVLSSLVVLVCIGGITFNTIQIMRSKPRGTDPVAEHAFAMLFGVPSTGFQLLMHLFVPMGHNLSTTLWAIDAISLFSMIGGSLYLRFRMKSARAIASQTPVT